MDGKTNKGGSKKLPSPQPTSPSPSTPPPEDMGLFGQCPSQDEFYLVMCEKCNKVIKPKAFRRHLKQRHGDSGVPPAAKIISRTSCSKSKLSPTKSSPNYKLSVPTKASVKEVPPAISNAQKLGAAINNKLSSGENSNKRNHHTVPIVKMERVELNKYPSHHIESSVNSMKTSPIMNGTSHGGSSSTLSSASSTPSSKSSSCTSTTPSPTTPVSQSMTIPSFSTSSSTVSVSSASLTTTTTTTCLTTTMTTTTVPTMTSFISPASAPNLAAAILASNPPSITPIVRNSNNSGSVSNLGGNISASSSAISTSRTAQASSASKKKTIHHLEKPEKLIPCKDREYDCNKHCGVIVEETGKSCTRSLTCKTHALSLRRKVPGRRKPFDELLKEHRAIKEALLKRKAEQKAADAEQKAAQLAGSQAKSAVPHGASPVVPHSAATSRVNHIPSSHTITQRSTVHKSAPRPQKVNHILPHRSGGFSSLHSPPHQSYPKDDTGAGPPLHQPPDGGHSSDVEGDDEEDDKTDRSYLTYHPRPAAMCTFGARHHSYNGRGCYMYNRRVDVLRAAFLNVLEKHLNPPPPKKLCVESNLPKEAQFLSNSKDPYEFNLIDTTAGATQHLNTVLNSSNNKNAVKPKSKPSSSRSKSKDGSSGGSRSPAHSSASAPLVTGAVKRKRSGSGGTAASPTSYSAVSGGYSAITTAISSIVNTHNTSTPLTAIAIPSVNLSNNTLSHFNANLAGGQTKNQKNNLIKDIGLVVRGTDLSSIVNGQYVIGGAQLLDEKLLQQHVMAGNKTNQKIVSNIEAVQKGHLYHTANAIFVDGPMQPGTTLLAPVTGSVPSNTVISIANTSVAHQASPATTTPSPLFRSGTASPQVSSPLPNGIVQSSLEKNSGRHLIQHKGPHKTLQTSSQSGLLSASQVINVTANNPQANHVFTQLAQLQVKPNMAKTGANKVTVQPVSLTFPITNLSAMAGQQTTLFITSSEEGQRHDLQQVSSSPSSLMS